MVLRVELVVLVFLLTATPMHAQDSVSALLPAPEALGVGWEITADLSGSAENIAESFPWASEYAYRRYAGPRSWRVVVIVARPRPGLAAAADAVEFVEGLVDNVPRDTDQEEEIRSPSALADRPVPTGCDAVSRAEERDKFFEFYTGATWCATDSGLVVYAIVSGGVGNAAMPDAAAPSAGSLTGVEASDAVVAAVVSGRSVHGMDVATPLATPAP